MSHWLYCWSVFWLCVIQISAFLGILFLFQLSLFNWALREPRKERVPVVQSILHCCYVSAIAAICTIIAWFGALCYEASWHGAPYGVYGRPLDQDADVAFMSTAGGWKKCGVYRAWLYQSFEDEACQYTDAYISGDYRHEGNGPDSPVTVWGQMLKALQADQLRVDAHQTDGEVLMYTDGVRNTYAHQPPQDQMKMAPTEIYESGYYATRPSSSAR